MLISGSNLPLMRRISPLKTLNLIRDSRLRHGSANVDASGARLVACRYLGAIPFCRASSSDRA